MTTVNYINISMQLWGSVMSLLTIACLILSRNRSLKERLYVQLLLYNTGSMIFDVFAAIFRGETTTLAFAVVRFSNMASYFCNFMLMPVFMQYLTEYLKSKTKVSVKPLLIVRIICAISIVCIIATQFYPIFYSIDENNIYHRAKFFWTSQILGIVGMVMCSWILFQAKGVIKRIEKIVFAFYLIAPVVAMLLQIFFYGIALLNIATTMSLIIIFLFLQGEQGRQMAEQANELTENRIDIMLSQIQPHFLYNILNTIGYLCQTNPKAAQKTTEEFATYLRGNLDSISRKAPITFDREMEHVKTYLALEKIRFEEELNVIYAVNATGFFLPSMTLQPLVENAVKHGIGKKPGGGTITIASKEYDNCFEITIEDDGIGYDVDLLPVDERSHVGIENVRNRLMLLCSGKLEIKSRIDVGTKVSIMIPKEK